MHLQALGALQYLEERGAIPFISDVEIVNPYRGINAQLKSIDFRAPEYDKEDPKMNSVTFSVMLNSLEEALAHRARELGVVIHEEATVQLERRPGTKRMHATLKFGGNSSIEKQMQDVDLGFPTPSSAHPEKATRVLNASLVSSGFTASTIPQTPCRHLDRECVALARPARSRPSIG